MSTYQSIEIKKDERTSLKGNGRKETGWKNIVLLGLIVFCGVVFLSHYSAENNQQLDDFLADQNGDNFGKNLNFAHYGYESFADEMGNVDVSDMSQVLTTLAKHGALDFTDLASTSSDRVSAVRQALTDIINKLNAEKVTIKNDYDNREKERLLVKAKANKAAADANAKQIAFKGTYDNLQKVADAAVATYNKEHSDDKQETDTLVSDLEGVIAEVDKLAQRTPSIHCQVDESVDFTTTGWSNRRYAGKVHGYFDSKSSRVVTKTFTGIKSTSGKVSISLRLVYAHSPDDEEIYVNVNKERKYSSKATRTGKELSVAEKTNFYPGISTSWGFWVRDINFVADLPSTGVIRLDIGCLLDQAWPDESWYFDNLKICDSGEPTQNLAFLPQYEALENEN